MANYVRFKMILQPQRRPPFPHDVSWGISPRTCLVEGSREGPWSPLACPTPPLLRWKCNINEQNWTKYKHVDWRRWLCSVFMMTWRCNNNNISDMSHRSPALLDWQLSLTGLSELYRVLTPVITLFNVNLLLSPLVHRTIYKMQNNVVKSSSVQLSNCTASVYNVCVYSSGTPILSPCHTCMYQWQLSGWTLTTVTSHPVTSHQVTSAVYQQVETCY